jgi:hypothetical protein
MNQARTWAWNVLHGLALVWIGMLLGVSFLATPVKFLAPSLTLAVALDVGRQTFSAFSMLEVVAALVLLTAAVLIRSQRQVVVFVCLISALVALQFFWLLPALDGRVEVILQGEMPGESHLHSVYIAIEAAKLALLTGISWCTRAASLERSRGAAADAR